LKLTENIYFVNQTQDKSSSGLIGLNSFFLWYNKYEGATGLDGSYEGQVACRGSATTLKGR